MAHEDHENHRLKSRYMQPDEEPMVKLVITALHDIGLHPVTPQVASKIAAALRSNVEPRNRRANDGQDRADC